MTMRTLNEDELLPLSMFASPDFSPLELSKKRQLISQAEILKLIADYERATSTELVTLVNENYKDFLQVSNDIKAVADRVASLKEPLPAKYVKFKADMEVILGKSSKIQEELSFLDQTRADNRLLDEIVDICLCVYAGVVGKEEFEFEEIPILSTEFERGHVLVEAAEAVQAEGLWKGTPALQESLHVIREELAVIKNEFVSKLLQILEKTLSSSHGNIVPNIKTIELALKKLQSQSKFSNSLKSRFFSELSLAGLPVYSFLAAVEKEYLISGCLYQQLVAGVDESLLNTLLVHSVVTEISAHGPAVFVPTSGSLGEFRKTFVACSNFFDRFSNDRPYIAEFLGKFKTSIYFNMATKPIIDTVSVGDVGGTISTILDRLFSPEILIDKKLIPRAVQLMVDLLEKLRTNASVKGLARISKLGKLFDSIPSLESVVELPVDKLSQLLAVETQLVAHTMHALISAVVSEVSNPIITTLESVKQVSALYRVASRGLPNRHSVYVELAMKSVAAFSEQLAGVPASDREWLERAIGEKISFACSEAFASQVSDLMVRERQRPSTSTTSPSELDKISCQLYLDMAKVDESLLTGRRSEKFKNVMIEFKKCYAKFSPS